MRDRYEGFLEASKSWNPSSLTASPCDVTDETITVAGAKLGDYAMASFSLDVSDVILDANVTSANTVTVTISYTGDVTKDLAAGTLRVRVSPF